MRIEHFAKHVRITSSSITTDSANLSFQQTVLFSTVKQTHASHAIRISTLQTGLVCKNHCLFVKLTKMQVKIYATFVKKDTIWTLFTDALLKTLKIAADMWIIKTSALLVGTITLTEMEFVNWLILRIVQK
jgi:hypothetical protein